MVIQEVYIGRIPEIEEMFQEFKKLRNEYKLYRTATNTKNTAKLEKMIEDFWGFKAFALKIDPSALPNAYTYPVAMSVDINPGDYIVSNSKGYKYSRECNAASISYITKGLLTGKDFSDEEVFAIFLHEIGHSFAHRSPMIIAQQEVYKNILIMQILYQLFLNVIIMNPAGIAQAVATYLMSRNGYKQLVAEFNKLVKKIPLLRELGVTFDVAIGVLKSTLYNFFYFMTSVTGVNYLANWISKRSYDNIEKKQFEISGHSQAYARSMERLSDDFATMYGFGPYLSTGLIKMENPDNQGAFMRITHKIPLLGTFLKKQDALSTELNGLLGAHPSSPDRILAILDSMEDDLKKDKSMPDKIKKELKTNITKQKVIINDLKKDQPTIAKNRNEYIEMLNKVGLEAGNSEDFMEKKYTDPDKLRKFYNDRKIRKESGITLEDTYLWSDEYVCEVVCENDDMFDDKARKNINKQITNSDIQKGKSLNGTVFKLMIKGLFATAGKSESEQYKWVREVQIPALVKACKTLDEIDYLRKDLYASTQQFATLKRNIKAVQNNDEQRMKRLSKGFIRKVQSGNVNIKEIEKHEHFLQNEYKKMLNDRAKEIRANNESVELEMYLLDPEVATFLE